jgi:peroxiredoxin
MGGSIVGISVDSPAESAKMASEIGVTYPILSDADLHVAGDYGVAMQGKDIAVPAVFVVRADKSIAWKTVGENVTDRPKAADVLAHARSAK